MYRHDLVLAQGSTKRQYRQHLQAIFGISSRHVADPRLLWLLDMKQPRIKAVPHPQHAGMWKREPQILISIS
jgi:hypothetical protein